MPIATNFCGVVLWLPSILMPLRESLLMSFPLDCQGLQDPHNTGPMLNPNILIHIPPGWVHGLNILTTRATENFRETKILLSRPHRQSFADVWICMQCPISYKLLRPYKDPCTYICIYRYLYIYIYVYGVYIYIYMYVYIYIYTHVCMCLF